jgi:hypothetical protein
MGGTHGVKVGTFLPGRVAAVEFQFRRNFSLLGAYVLRLSLIIIVPTLAIWVPYAWWLMK